MRECGEELKSVEKTVFSTVSQVWKVHFCLCSSVGYSTQWATKTYPMSRLIPPCQPVKSRGALVTAFSPDGQLLAIVLNQKRPKVSICPLCLISHIVILFSLGPSICRDVNKDEYFLLLNAGYAGPICEHTEFCLSIKWPWRMWKQEDRDPL